MIRCFITTKLTSKIVDKKNLVIDNIDFFYALFFS